LVETERTKEEEEEEEEEKKKRMDSYSLRPTKRELRVSYDSPHRCLLPPPPSSLP